MLMHALGCCHELKTPFSEEYKQNKITYLKQFVGQSMPHQFAAGMQGWWAFCRSFRAKICCDWLVNVLGSCVIMATMSFLWACQSAISSWIQSDVWGSAVFFILMLLVTCFLWNFRWHQSQAQQSQEINQRR